MCALEDLVLSYLKRRLAAVREGLRYEGVPVLLYRTLKKAASPVLDVVGSPGTELEFAL